MDRHDKIQMMNEILALDQELDSWIGKEEKLLAEEGGAMRERIAGLREKIARLSEGEELSAPAPDEGAGYGSAEIWRREAAAENTRIQEQFQARQGDFVAQLLAKCFEN